MPWPRALVGQVTLRRRSDSLRALALKPMALYRPKMLSLNMGLRNTELGVTLLLFAVGGDRGTIGAGTDWVALLMMVADSVEAAVLVLL